MMNIFGPRHCSLNGILLKYSFYVLFTVSVKKIFRTKWCGTHLGMQVMVICFAQSYLISIDVRGFKNISTCIYSQTFFSAEILSICVHMQVFRYVNILGGQTNWSPASMLTTRSIAHNAKVGDAGIEMRDGTGSIFPYGRKSACGMARMNSRCITLGLLIPSGEWSIINPFPFDQSSSRVTTL